MSPFVDALLTIVYEHASRNIILNEYGIFDRKAQKAWYENHRDIPLTPFTREALTADISNIAKVIDIIPFLVIRTTRKGLVGSYGLKHVLERHIPGYVSNGVAILAMLYLNYNMIMSNEGSPNSTFLCNYVKSDASAKL